MSTNFPVEGLLWEAVEYGHRIWVFEVSSTQNSQKEKKKRVTQKWNTKTYQFQNSIERNNNMIKKTINSRVGRHHSKHVICSRKF